MSIHLLDLKKIILRTKNSINLLNPTINNKFLFNKVFFIKKSIKISNIKIFIIFFL